MYQTYVVKLYCLRPIVNVCRKFLKEKDVFRPFRTSTAHCIFSAGSRLQLSSGKEKTSSVRH